ncbi:MAG: hypothetical protein FJ137_00595 [Deltaproteobacteria bacterium]|nr:hypothetical protein [Deltaproteobacteria bacterium]
MAHGTVIPERPDVDLTPARARGRETLRLCWELVAARRQRGVDPLAALLSSLAREGLARLRSPERDVRVVAVVELDADAGVARARARAVADAAATLARQRIALDVWPQLPDADRFLNTRTARRFHERLLPLLHALADQLATHDDGAHPGLFLDVEPTLDLLEGAWAAADARPVWQRARGLAQLVGGVAGALWDARQGRRDLRELLSDLKALPFAVVAAVPPPVLPLDAPAGDAALHWLLGCPAVDDDGAPLFARTAALCYAPILARRGADRDAQHRALSLWAARHKERGEAICLGPLSTGLLGDEPTYASPAHLRHDLSAVRALGFDDVTLYSLEGLLFGPAGDPDAGLRADLDEWLAVLAPAPASTAT